MGQSLGCECGHHHDDDTTLGVDAFGAMFSKADADGNGVVDRAELKVHFTR